jgi:endonuclease I
MNTEHTWPQSQGADQFPAKCDLHHLYPTDTDANSLRGNHPFDEVVDESWTGGGSRFGTNARGETAFEPRDEHKGNVARSMLYFAMRYGHDLSAEDLALYQGWSAADPADDVEIERSLRIGERQGAANPYVVCPGLVERL